ncbi:MAG TPA: hypothetical protein VMS73_09580 [Anaerolineaceae bacterium]|nr:hypothetical protein [Anaerolineaceae bacterium]
MTKRANKIKQIKDKNSDAAPPPHPPKPAADAKTPPASGGMTPWISFKTGLIIITICSIGMAVFTAVQYVPAVGLTDGIIYGLLYGAMIWAVFFLSQLFYRWLRK